MNLVRGAFVSAVVGAALPVAIDAQVQPLTVTRTRDLRFRTLMAGFPSTVTRLQNQAGRVSIRGQRNAEITAQWTLPGNMLHTTQGDPLPVSFGPNDAGYGDRQNLNNMTAWDPSTILVTRLAANNGRKHFALGGTASPASNQRIGQYRGQIALTVAYTGN